MEEIDFFQLLIKGTNILKILDSKHTKNNSKHNPYKISCNEISQADELHTTQ